MIIEAVLLVYCSRKEVIVYVISCINDRDEGHGVTMTYLSTLGDQVAAKINGD